MEEIFRVYMYIRSGATKSEGDSMFRTMSTQLETRVRITPFPGVIDIEYLPSSE